MIDFRRPIAFFGLPLLVLTPIMRMAAGGSMRSIQWLAMVAGAACIAYGLWPRRRRVVPRNEVEAIVQASTKSPDVFLTTEAYDCPCGEFAIEPAEYPSSVSLTVWCPNCGRQIERGGVGGVS